MIWWQKLFGGTDAVERDQSGTDVHGPSLETTAFRVTDSGVKPPACSLDSGQKEWLFRIEQGRRNAVKFRRDFLADKPFLKDPVDQPMPNWFSVGIVFDVEKMESDYGRQVFEAFFHQVQPSDIQSEVVMHFGDLIRFDAFCSLIARGRKLEDILAILSKFGPDVSAPGLIPYGTRFVTADKKDGHVIARSFSLPISATVRSGRIAPDPQAGVSWMIEAAIKGTSWKM
jgi:hypothetical protein